MHNTDKLSQHAVTQSQDREARHTIPASPIISQESQTSYPSMYSADKLSQHALKNMHFIKEATKAQKSRQADTAK